jgi:hypothetical protein
MDRYFSRGRGRGREHGPARGMAVYGSGGSESPDAVKELLSRCESLRSWSLARSVDLDDEPESLIVLDRLLDSWKEPSAAETLLLANDVGAYLGTVIVTHVEGTQWTLWPNGHPVVRLRSGRDLDVIDLSNRRLNESGEGLESIFTSARDA